MTTEAVQVKSVEFNGDKLMAAKTIQGEIFAGVSYVCNSIGLSKSQKDTQIQNIQLDEVLKRGCLKFQAGVFDPNNPTVAILIDYLPLWLAKISITPKMKENNKELVEKLITYQLKAKDVLAAAFLSPKMQGHPIIEQHVHNLEQQLITLSSQLQTHTEFIQELQNNISTSNKAIPSTLISRPPITQLIQLRNDSSPYGAATYRQIYKRMLSPRSWKQRITKYKHNHSVVHATKSDVVNSDYKLARLFELTVADMIAELTSN